MTHRLHNDVFFTHRKTRREKVLRKMAAMREAKARKRMENPVEREPKRKRWFPFELGVRDKRTGEIAWIDLRSVRDASKRLAVVIKYA